jgi:hypothetical protein
MRDGRKYIVLTCGVAEQTHSYLIMEAARTSETSVGNYFTRQYRVKPSNTATLLQKSILLKREKVEWNRFNIRSWSNSHTNKLRRVNENTVAK